MNTNETVECIFASHNARKDGHIYALTIGKSTISWEKNDAYFNLFTKGEVFRSVKVVYLSEIIDLLKKIG